MTITADNDLSSLSLKVGLDRQNVHASVRKAASNVYLWP